MIVLELLYLLAFVLFLAAAFVWTCIKSTSQKTTESPIVKSSPSSTFKSSQSNNCKSNIGSQEWKSQLLTLDSSENPALNNLPAQKLVLKTQKIVKIEMDVPEKEGTKVENNKIEPEKVNNLAMLPKDLGEIPQSNSMLQANSSLISQQQVSECQNIQKKKELREVRMKERLKAVKNHYKNIIDELKRKLEEVCIRNNESLSIADPNETITFSEEDSLVRDQNEEHNFFLEMKVEEIENLKDELQFHEQMVTAMLEGEEELKDRLKVLEEENLKLKESISGIPLQSRFVEQNEVNKLREENQRIIQRENIKEKEELTYKLDHFLNKSHCVSVNKDEEDEKSSQFSRSQKLDKEQKVRSTIVEHKDRSSPIKNLYTSQIAYPFKEINLFSTKPENPSALSTISMMSIIEGAISIGLLGECRFLNEISKKYTINEVKKTIKKRIGDAQMIYSSTEIKDYETKKLSKIVLGQGNILFLVKLNSGNTFACFIEHPIAQSQRQNQKQGCLLLINLTQRKIAFVGQGFCLQTERGLIIGQNELEIEDGNPVTISCRGLGSFITQQAKVQAIFGPNLTEKVETIEVFVLYPASDD